MKTCKKNMDTNLETIAPGRSLHRFPNLTYL